MQEPKRKGFSRARFQGSGLRAVAVPVGELIKTCLLDDSPLPLVIEPAAQDLDLADWAAANLDFLNDRLLHHGAILFRGFGITSAARFERVAGSLCSRLYSDNGEHQHDRLSGNVYTPVFYAPEKHLLWHNENSFNHRWPAKILFCCTRPAAVGGETPLVDSRRVYERVEPRLRQRFEDRGVLYTRNYGAGVGLDWQSVFQVTEPEEVEKRCAADGFETEWKGDGVLRTSCVRPAAVQHPQSGEMSWFNQAQHWHVSCLEAEVRRSLESSYAEEDLPRNCYYGDGSVIEDSVMEEILGIYGELEVSFPWHRGDVLLVDNVLAAHGRNPFTGERKILVSMGDMKTYDEL